MGAQPWQAAPCSHRCSMLAPGVPKHASWLNMVEIEIGVLGKQCLDRRIPERETLQREIVHWQRQRNAEGARVEWMFDVRRAREKLGRVYPSPSFTDLPKAA